MDYEKLTVYQKAKEFKNRVADEILSIKALDKNSRDQLRRASLSIPLNIAEGSSRFSKADRKKYYVIARGSAIECDAVVDLIKPEVLDLEIKTSIRGLAEEISKMLFVMIRNLEKS